MINNNSIIYFSENVFDRKIYKKSEIKIMINNLIKEINLFNFHYNNKEIKNTIINFGIANQDNYDDLSKYIGQKLFNELKLSISKINEKIIYNSYPDIAKYSKKYRIIKSYNSYKSKKPTLVDLFCGSGGLSLGLIQSGFKVAFANDIDKSALQSYSFNHPEILGKNITMGGIEKIVNNINDYVSSKIDVIAGGPPCQGFSTANRQRVINDPRNVLYKYYVKSVQKLKPKIFIMENVKGMKKVASQVVDDVNSKNDVNYDISYYIFNAKNFGVPQNRERLIYIGVRNDLCQKIDSITIIKKLIKKNKFGNGNVLSDAISDLHPLKASRKKNATSIDSNLTGSLISKNKKFSVYNNEYLKIINNYENYLIFNHKARYNNNRDIEIYSRMLPGDRSDSNRIADIMPYKSRNNIFKDKYFKLFPYKICKTITAHMRYDCNMYIHPYQARGLTPREAARIQSYPDDFFFLGAYTKTYQQIGNSVPPLMARIIGKEIIQYLR